jgi:hypothetical protein
VKGHSAGHLLGRVCDGADSRHWRIARHTHLRGPHARPGSTLLHGKASPDAARTLTQVKEGAGGSRHETA